MPRRRDIGGEGPGGFKVKFDGVDTIAAVALLALIAGALLKSARWLIIIGVVLLAVWLIITIVVQLRKKAE